MPQDGSIPLDTQDTHEIPSDDEEPSEIDDWRTRPPKPPPRKSKYMQLIDHMVFRVDDTDDDVERDSYPVPEARRSASPPDGLLRGMRRIPREVTYEVMRTSPELVSIYNAARAEYADAIYAWWHASAVRERYDTPTDLDYELVKLDPRVRRAERALQAVDAQLSANAQPVKTATLRNDGSARRTMMDETERIDAEWRAAQQQQEKRTRKRRRKTIVDPVPDPVPAPLPDATVEAAAALTPASIASTARTSLSADIPSDHYSATSPEPEDDDASDTDAYVPSWKVKVDAAAAAGPSNLSLKRRKAA